MPPQIATRYGMKSGGGGVPGGTYPPKKFPSAPPPRGYEHLSAPIRHVTFRLRDQRGAASLRHRNRAATTVLACEQMPYPV